jgi:hypothetical protein
MKMEKNYIVLSFHTIFSDHTQRKHTILHSFREFENNICLVNFATEVCLYYSQAQFQLQLQVELHGINIKQIFSLSETRTAISHPVLCIMNSNYKVNKMPQKCTCHYFFILLFGYGRYN